VRIGVDTVDRIIKTSLLIANIAHELLVNDIGGASKPGSRRRADVPRNGG
jgi:hypothetical protein